MGKNATPAWWWPADELLLRPLVRAAAPELLRPCFNGSATPFSMRPKSNFRAFLDLAVLSTVDACMKEGHMGDIVGRVRQSIGRTACLSVHDATG